MHFHGFQNGRNTGQKFCLANIILIKLNPNYLWNLIHDIFRFLFCLIFSPVLPSLEFPCRGPRLSENSAMVFLFSNFRWWSVVKMSPGYANISASSDERWRWTRPFLFGYQYICKCTYKKVVTLTGKYLIPSVSVQFVYARKLVTHMTLTVIKSLYWRKTQHLIEHTLFRKKEQ